MRLQLLRQATRPMSRCSRARSVRETALPLPICAAGGQELARTWEVTGKWAKWGEKKRPGQSIAAMASAGGTFEGNLSYSGRREQRRGVRGPPGT